MSTNLSSLGVSPELAEFDPKAAQTLNTINRVGLSLEQMLEEQKGNISTRKGIIAGMAATYSVVDRVKNQVQREIDDNKLDGEQAKVILGWLQKTRAEIEISVGMNQRELAIQEGIIEGLNKACERCEVLFKQEDIKTRSRMNESERGNRDEGGRPRPLREIMDEKDAASDIQAAPEVAPEAISEEPPVEDLSDFVPSDSEPPKKRRGRPPKIR
jgi:hypothetical protein